MAECTYCKSETELYDGGSPICVQCADMSAEGQMARAKLSRKLQEATMRAKAANAFSDLSSKTQKNG